MSSLIQMSPKQRIRANKLIRRMCANFMDGACVCLDCECPQIISYSLLCKYFKRAVLPLDKELEAEVEKSNVELRCSDCGVPIEKTGNKRQFCELCSRKRYLAAKAKYEREKRYMRGKIEG